MSSIISSTWLRAVMSAGMTSIVSPTMSESSSSRMHGSMAPPVTGALPNWSLARYSPAIVHPPCENRGLSLCSQGGSRKGNDAFRAGHTGGAADRVLGHGSAGSRPHSVQSLGAEPSTAQPYCETLRQRGSRGLTAPPPWRKHSTLPVYQRTGALATSDRMFHAQGLTDMRKVVYCVIYDM